MNWLAATSSKKKNFRMKSFAKTTAALSVLDNGNWASDTFTWFIKLLAWILASYLSLWQQFGDTDIQRISKSCSEMLILVMQAHKAASMLAVGLGASIPGQWLHH